MKKRVQKKESAKPDGSLVKIIAGFDRDPFTKAFQGILKPSDATLTAKGQGKGLEIYDNIEQDCHAYAVLQKRKLAVVSFPWEVDPATEDSSDTKAADGIREMLEGVDMDGLTLSLLDALLKGFAVSEIEWNPETWTPVKFHPRNQRRFLFDGEGNPRLITPDNQQEGVPLPERKFIIHRFGAKDGNPYGLGLGTRLFWPTYFKNQGIAFWLLFAEKFGGPTILGKYPDFMDEAKQNALLEALSNASQKTAIVAPLGSEVELLQAAKSDSIDTYERLLTYMDAAISKAVLGETLTTEVGDNGSYAASQTHNGVRMELIRADADLLSNTLNESLLTWLTDFHFPGANPPRIWRRVEAPNDMKAEAEKDQILFNIGFDPEEQFIQEKYGVGWTKRVGMGGMGGMDLGLSGLGDSIMNQPSERPPETAEAAPSDAPLPQGEISSGPVQDTALNGAQVAALVQVIEQVAAGVIPKASAGPILRAAFPAIRPELVEQIIGPVVVKEAVPQPVKEPAPAREAEFAEVDDLDKLADRSESRGSVAMARLLEPVRRLVRKAQSIDEIRDGILELYPDMDSAGVADMLTEAMIAAYWRGDVGVRK